MAADYFKKNAVVRSLNVLGQNAFISAPASSLLQGTPLDIGLKLLNFGAVKSQKGEATLSVKVISGQARLNSSSSVSLDGIDARTGAAFEKLAQVQILPQARPGSTFEVEMKLTYKGDDFQALHQEVLVYKGVVVENPVVRTRLNYETKPQFRTIFRNYREHDVVVALTGLNTDVPGQYEVELKPETSSDASRVEIVRGSAKIGTVQAEEVKSATLQYKFNKRAKDKTIKLKVVVKYQGKVLSEESLTVVPD